jgi:polyisoprenyl-teichoic acid--peptidoglycan teichoic acid transferase
MTESPEREFLRRVYGSRQTWKLPAESAPPEPKKRGPTLFISGLVMIIFFSALTGFILALFSRFLIFESILTLMPGEKLLAETNILVLGLDQGEQVHRSDTIMVVHIDPAKNQVNVVSIPRDTIVSIPGRGLDKINHAYAFGGAELSRASVENFLGIKLPYYLSIDTGSLAGLIDEIGGITLDVEKRMYYIDNSQGLFVDLKPGVQKLNGHDAMSYLRYRHDGGDVTRILRQQKFIQALASQIMAKENLMRSPQLVLKMFSYLETNLNTREILGMAINLRKIVEFGQIRTASLPGSDMMIDGVYYMKPDLDEVKKAVDGFLKSSS